MLASVVLTGCDTYEAQQAVDDFSVVVELPAIETVASVQVMDLATRAPVAREVTLTFDGADADAVVDVYSDPISSTRLRGGFTSFGINNLRVPAADDPVELVVHAEARGYQTTSVPLRIDETGTVSVRIPMLRDDPRQSPPGVTGERQKANADNGVLAQDVSFTQEPAPSTESADAQETARPRTDVRMARGTQLADASGTPLRGRLTVDLSTYDNSADGLRAMPAQLRSDAPGRSTVSALRLKVTDADGRVASRFEAGSEEALRHAAANRTRHGVAHSSTSSSTSSSTNGLSFTLSTGTVPQAMDLSHYVLRLQSGTDVVDVHVPLSVVSGDSLTFGVQGSTLLVGSETHDISTLAASTDAYYISLQGVATQTCTPSGSIVIDPNGHTGSVTLTASGNGLYYEKTVSVTAGHTKSVAVDALVTDASLPDITSAWPVVAAAPNGEATSAEMDLCSSASRTLTLPAPSSSLIDATVNLEPGCPAGQSIPFTGNIDGYVLNYRKAGTTADFQPVPGSAVTVYSTDTAFEGADVGLTNVDPNADYEFYGAFDGNSGYRTITMPATNGGTVTFTDSEISQHCQ